MFKYKVHCSVRGSLKTKIVYVFAPMKTKASVLSEILRQYPTLKPLKIYFVGEFQEEEKPKPKKRKTRKKKDEVNDGECS